MVSNEDCTVAYVEYGGVTDNQMCAEREGKDACQDDSGGPLIVKGENASSDVLVGIVSSGVGCATEGYPGVYARISSQISWILNEIDNGVDPVDDDIPYSDDYVGWFEFYLSTLLSLWFPCLSFCFYW